MDMKIESSQRGSGMLFSRFFSGMAFFFKVKSRRKEMLERY